MQLTKGAGTLTRRGNDCQVDGSAFLVRPYWIADREASHPANEPPPDGQGALADFARWMLKMTG